MLERVEAGNDPAGAMSKQKHRPAGFARLHEPYEGREVVHIVGEFVDVEALAIRSAAPPMVEGVGCQAACDQLLCCPQILAAVRIEPVRDDHDSARLRGRIPRSEEDIDPTNTLE